MPNLITLFLLPLLILTDFTHAIRLSDLQGIISFPEACTRAYDRDIADCTLSELSLTGVASSSGAGLCSLQCIRGLTVIGNALNFECGTTRGRPGTLIALFFNNQGVEYLCPNSREGFDPAPTSTVAAAETNPAIETTDAAAEPTAAATTADDSAAPTTTLPPKDSSMAAAFPTYTAIDKGVAEVITSESQRANSENADAFGGGGSPFEVAANAATAQTVGLRLLGGWVAAMLVLGFTLGWG